MPILPLPGPKWDLGRGNRARCGHRAGRAGPGTGTAGWRGQARRMGRRGLDPFGRREPIDAYAAAGFEALAMEFMPRITRAQSMDVLSRNRTLPATRPSSPRRRLWPGLSDDDDGGGHGQRRARLRHGRGRRRALQAIATARRLGAQVSATDVRSATKEQIQSLGAKPIFVESVAGIEGEGAGGYATEMSRGIPEGAGRTGPATSPSRTSSSPPR
jgi:hypothetical protein